MCGDWQRADDLVQTALTKAYVAWPRIRRHGREEAYVRQILVRAHIDERRRPWRREVPGLDGVDVAPREDEDTSDVFEALQALPIMQRKTVLLRHWLGLSVRETAEELGIAEGTVKSHCSRALEALHEQLTQTR